MGKCRHGSYAKSAVSGSCYQCKIEELESQLEKEKRRRITSTRINNELHARIEDLEDKTLVEELEAELAVKTKLINNIKTCCSIRSVTAFLDRYEQALENES